MLQKPPHGSPCNNCGLCCMDSLCALGSKVFPKHSNNCPALERSGVGFSCGLVSNTEKYAPDVVKTHGKEKASTSALLLVGGGFGCDAKLSGEPYNEAFIFRYRFWREKNKAIINAASYVWAKYIRR